MKIEKAVVRYILDLSESADATHHAEDRPVYESYLADAAFLFALVVDGAEKAKIEEYIQGHERLWGHSWLQDPVYKKPRESFEKIKKLAGYKIT